MRGGGHSIAISPYDAQAENDFSVAIGRQSYSGGDQATAVGNRTYAASYGAAVGTNVKSGKGSVSIGAGITSGYSNTINIGYDSEAIGGMSNAIGVRSTAFGKFVDAIGYNAQVGSFENYDINKQISDVSNTYDFPENSVAIGAYSMVDDGQKNVVSFGNDRTSITLLRDIADWSNKGKKPAVAPYFTKSTRNIPENFQNIKRRLINVADPINDNDVVNLKTLNDLKEEINTSIENHINTPINALNVIYDKENNIGATVFSSGEKTPVATKEKGHINGVITWNIKSEQIAKGLNIDKDTVITYSALGFAKVNDNDTTRKYIFVNPTQNDVPGVARAGDGLQCGSPDDPSEIAKLNLKPATSTTIGGVKVGQGISVTEDGTISVITQSTQKATDTSLGVVMSGDATHIDNDGRICVGVGSGIAINDNLLVQNVIDHHIFTCYKKSAGIRTASIDWYSFKTAAHNIFNPTIYVKTTSSFEGGTNFEITFNIQGTTDAQSMEKSHMKYMYAESSAFVVMTSNGCILPDAKASTYLSNNGSMLLVRFIASEGGAGMPAGDIYLKLKYPYNNTLMSE